MKNTLSVAPLSEDILLHAFHADAGEVIRARLGLDQSAGKGNRARRRAAALVSPQVSYWLKREPFRHVRIRRYAVTGR
jgi:hypothetical protein